MSLTRAEWLEMWAAIKRIEGFVVVVNAMGSKRSRSDILDDVDTIKGQIQSVVGQLETEHNA